MAYKNKNETVKVLEDVLKNDRGDYIRVSHIENNSEVSYDLRNMYTLENGELGFTSRGIRLKSDMMIEIMKHIIWDLSEEDRKELLKVVSPIEEE